MPGTIVLASLPRAGRLSGDRAREAPADAASSNDQAGDNGCNDSLAVETDAKGIPEPDQGHVVLQRGREKQYLTFEGAVEYYWDAHIRGLQVD